MESGQKNKRRTLTLQEKKKIIDASTGNDNRTELAKQFGISRTTLNGIIGPKRKIEEAIEAGGSASISFKAIQGEAGAIDMVELRDWQMQILRDSLKEFPPDDIFNIDETGLFWQL